MSEQSERYTFTYRDNENKGSSDRDSNAFIDFNHILHTGSSAQKLGRVH